MSLIITQTYATIGIDRDLSKLQIDAQNARLKLQQNHAKVNIEMELPSVEIDQYEAFASAGLKNYRDLAKETAQKGYRQVMQYIGKVVADGDAMAAIENGGNPIAEIAKRDSYKMREFNIGFIPKARPEITVTGHVEIDALKNAEGINNGVDGTFIPAEFNLNYASGNVEIFLSQYASIKFDYIENKINAYV